MMRQLMAAMLVGLMTGPPSFAQQAATGGTFTLKVQSEIVLTNVVVRDKKTGDVVKNLKASDFTILENGKPQAITSFDYQTVDEAVVTRTRTQRSAGKTTHCRSGEQRLCGDPQRAERPSPDRDVLRSQQHAARGHRPRGRVRPGLHQQEDAAGRSRCSRQPGYCAQHGSGLYRR